MSLTRAFQALRLTRMPMCNLSTSAAVSSLPSNLFLFPEKPKPAPRFVSREPLVFDSKGNIEAKVLSFTDGSALDTITLNRSVFGATIRKDILQRVVKWQLANRRSGNHKTKTRSEVSGSTRKPFAQKGSGRARVGNIRAPQWRGGYTVHGPVVRDHSYCLPKKVRAMGLRVALSTKLAEGKLAIVKDLNVEVPKTKSMKNLLTANGWDHALFIDGEEAPRNFVLATQNIPYVEVIRDRHINVYAILHKDILVLSEKTVAYLEERLAVK